MNPPRPLGRGGFTMLFFWMKWEILQIFKQQKKMQEEAEKYYESVNN